MLYIDTCSLNDYDQVIRLFLQNNINIIERNKMKMVIAAEISLTLLAKLLEENDFKEVVSSGDKPLD